MRIYHFQSKWYFVVVTFKALSCWLSTLRSHGWRRRRWSRGAPRPAGGAPLGSGHPGSDTRRRCASSGGLNEPNRAERSRAEPNRSAAASRGAAVLRGQLQLPVQVLHLLLLLQLLQLQVHHTQTPRRRFHPRRLHTKQLKVGRRRA